MFFADKPRTPATPGIPTLVVGVMPPWPWAGTSGKKDRKAERPGLLFLKLPPSDVRHDVRDCFLFAWFHLFKQN